MAAAAPVQGKILLLSLDQREHLLFETTYSALLAQLNRKARVETIRTADSAAQLLCADVDTALSFDCIFLTDAALTTKRHRQIWRGVVEYIRAGGVAVCMGSFPLFVHPWAVKPFFGLTGLPWTTDDFAADEFVANTEASGGYAAAWLPPTMSCRALLLKYVQREHAWYREDGSRRNGHGRPNGNKGRSAGNRTAVAMGSVGAGHLGYIGDVGAEPATILLALEMCGLLRPGPGDTGAGRLLNGEEEEAPEFDEDNKMICAKHGRRTCDDCCVDFTGTDDEESILDEDIMPVPALKRRIEKSASTASLKPAREPTPVREPTPARKPTPVMETASSEMAPSESTKLSPSSELIRARRRIDPTNIFGEALPLEPVSPHMSATIMRNLHLQAQEFAVVKEPKDITHANGIANGIANGSTNGVTTSSDCNYGPHSPVQAATTLECLERVYGGGKTSPDAPTSADIAQLVQEESMFVDSVQHTPERTIGGELALMKPPSSPVARSNDVSPPKPSRPPPSPVSESPAKRIKIEAVPSSGPVQPRPLAETSSNLPPKPSPFNGDHSPPRGPKALTVLKPMSSYQPPSDLDPRNLHYCQSCRLTYIAAAASSWHRSSSTHPFHPSNDRAKANSYVVVQICSWKEHAKGNEASSSIGVFFGRESQHNVSRTVNSDIKIPQAVELLSVIEALETALQKVMPDRDVSLRGHQSSQQRGYSLLVLQTSSVYVHTTLAHTIKKWSETSPGQIVNDKGKDVVLSHYICAIQKLRATLSSRRINVLLNLVDKDHVAEAIHLARAATK